MDRHLLPEEIDQLLDGEVGFGTAPLKAHARACAACRAELDAAGSLVRELERLPRFAPSPRFADRVMQDVHVFVPWHVALLDTVRAWAPRSSGVRALAWTGAGAAAAVLTIISVFVLTRLDVLLFAAEMGLGRLRDAVTAATGGAVAGIFGGAAARAVSSAGLFGIVLAVLVALLGLAVAARAVRAVVANDRR